MNVGCLQTQFHQLSGGVKLSILEEASAIVNTRDFKHKHFFCNMLRIKTKQNNFKSHQPEQPINNLLWDKEVDKEYFQLWLQSHKFLIRYFIRILESRRKGQNPLYLSRLNHFSARRKLKCDADVLKVWSCLYISRLTQQKNRSLRWWWEGVQKSRKERVEFGYAWVFLLHVLLFNSYSSRTRRIWADIYNQRGRRPSWLLSAHIRQVREE